MANRIHIPTAAICLIKKWEGFEPEVYQDAVGIDTIGYGFTEPALNRIGKPMPDVVTVDEADRLLGRLLVVHYGPQIDRMMPGLLPHKLGALCSLAYNIGLTAFERSTLLAKLRAGREDEAEEEFARWVYAGGDVLRGLVRRRKDERHYFEKDETLYSEAEVKPIPVRGVEAHEDVDVAELTPDRIDPYYGS